MSSQIAGVRSASARVYEFAASSACACPTIESAPAAASGSTPSGSIP